MESANGKTNIPIEDSTDLLVLLLLLQRFTVVAIYSALLEHQEGTGPVSNRCLQEYLCIHGYTWLLYFLSHLGIQEGSFSMIIAHEDGRKMLAK